MEPTQHIPSCSASPVFVTTFRLDNEHLCSSVGHCALKPNLHLVVNPFLIFQKRTCKRISLPFNFLTNILCLNDCQAWSEQICPFNKKLTTSDPKLFARITTDYLGSTEVNMMDLRLKQNCPGFQKMSVLICRQQQMGCSTNWKMWSGERRSQQPHTLVKSFGW